MKALLAASAAFVLVSLAASAQTAKPAAQPAPATAAGVQVSTGGAAPKGATEAKVEDVRVLGGASTDPFELERLGLAAAAANQLDRARFFFERAWTLGELPTAAYNLACLEARTGRVDQAFAGLDKAIAAGFDDGVSLEKDPDLAALRGKPKFKGIVSGAAKNRAAGDAAAVTEGVFLLPKDGALAILLLLHDKESDPFTVSGPFTDLALASRLCVAAPRGPGRSAKKRFGWGSADRAVKAIGAAVSAARRKAGNPKLPVLLVGVGRGGTEAFTAAARSAPGTFAGVGSIGGPFDPGVAPNPAGLRGARLFLGFSRDAPPAEVAATRRGIDALHQQGLQPVVAEWPGAGSGFPKDARRAAKETLDAFAGQAPAAPR
ncbi:MAG: TPR end-of-group domain-containing protein [Thermoanaerobaculia bacterium]